MVEFESGAYIFVFLIIILFAVLSWIFKLSEKHFLFLSCLILVLFSGLRGDFSTDYSHYVHIYRTIPTMDISDWTNLSWEIFYVEKGFALLCYLFGKFFSNPTPTFFLFTSVLIVLPHYVLIKKEKCCYPWIYLILFFMFGAYFQGFNVMRQAMASSLFLLAFDDLKNGRFAKYSLKVLLVATIHVTAIFMIPVYFIFRMKPNIKNILLMFFSVVFLSVFYYDIIFFVDNVFFNGYFFRQDDYASSLNFNSIVFPLALCVFSIVVYILKYRNNVFGRSNLSSRDVAMVQNKEMAIHPKMIRIEDVCFNGMLLWTGSLALSLVTEYFVRISLFFAPFAFFSLIYSLRSIEAKRRQVYVLAFVLVLIVYQIFFNTPYEMYYFYWR